MKSWLERTSGILHPRAAARNFRLTRHPPSRALAPFVAWYWIMRWALNKAYRQTVISPSIDAATGKPRDWADLAARLGYADQAHFIRDFKRFVGQSPSRYAATAAG